MTLGATVGWPAAAVLGFFVLTALVVALGASSTARYEFERNGAGQRRRPAPSRSGAHPAGSARARRSAGAPTDQPRAGSVGLAVRPAPAPPAGGHGWWLVDESARVLAGPFADRTDADWAALADGLPAIAVHGARSADGGVTPRLAPEERAWLTELGGQLDRLPADWDALLSDTDPLTTLVVEVAATLVEAGLPLHGTAQGHPAGGVCLMPELALGGVLVSWHAHDRMSLHQLRGAAADATVRRCMNAAVADVLTNLGFVVEPFGATGSSVVTALR
ncbi:hypothetical protein OF117_14810 [Geodermatophilus sp. YIM 151500]|uniref:hypothetical protein n=1 Tax=Geodermatophilus sp. YIM 151500 TaxID=2984531 RepID=UPI0021E48168|nr:hypothetical protein [Geodermatophilus sp. YIM 151500]MCV2490631.1 hypothetical protein [Geodermatophilus sp. YIM 151500]